MCIRDSYNTLSKTRSDLEEKINLLKDFESDYRKKIKSFLENIIQSVETEDKSNS